MIMSKTISVSQIKEAAQEAYGNIIRLQAGIPRQTEKVSLIKTKQRSSSRRTLHCMHSGNLRNIRLPIN